MTRDRKGLLAEIDPEIICADGFDEALIGYVEIFTEVVALYDRDKCIQVLMDQGMTYGEAEEYFSYNVQGAYVGEKTPAFATFPPEWQASDAQALRQRLEEAERALADAQEEIARLKGDYDA